MCTPTYKCLFESIQSSRGNVLVIIQIKKHRPLFRLDNCDRFLILRKKTKNLKPLYARLRRVDFGFRRVDVGCTITFIQLLFCDNVAHAYRDVMTYTWYVGPVGVLFSPKEMKREKLGIINNSLYRTRHTGRKYQCFASRYEKIYTTLKKKV